MGETNKFNFWKVLLTAVVGVFVVLVGLAMINPEIKEAFMALFRATKPVVVEKVISLDEGYTVSEYQWKWSFTPVKCDENVVTAIIDGVTVAIIPDDPANITETVVVGTYDGGTGNENEYKVASFFSCELWNDKLNTEFQAFPEASGENLKQVVMFEGLPEFVDPIKWDKTWTSLVMWKYPIGPTIVENFETGELALLIRPVFLINDELSPSYLNPGSFSNDWYLHTEPVAGAYGIFMSQSEPDFSLKDKVQAAAMLRVPAFTHEDNFAWACILMKTENYDPELVLTEAEYKDLCGVYAFSGGEFMK